MNARAIFGAALGVSALAMVGALACSEPSYSFLGRRYIPERDCLQSTVSIDVLRGKDPGNCPVRCVAVKGRNDAGQSIDVPFVTIMCPPDPYEVRPWVDRLYADRDEGICTDALEAFERRANCLADGGSSSPVEDASLDAPVDAPPAQVDATIDPPDAAPTVDAASDAPLDATSD